MRLYLHYQANVTMTTELVSSAVTYLSSFQNNCLTRCFQLSRFASPTHCYCPIIWLSCYLVSTRIVLPLVFVLLVFVYILVCTTLYLLVMRTWSHVR